MKALAVQLLGHPGQRLSRLAELVDSIQEPPVVGHLLVTLHRAHQLVAAAKASCPVDGHVDPFALPTDGGDHLLDQEADDPLAIRCRRSRRLPQPRQLLRQGMDLVALASRQTRGLVAAEPGVFLLRDDAAPSKPPPSAAPVPAPPGGSPVRPRRAAAVPARPDSGRAPTAAASSGAAVRSCSISSAAAKLNSSAAGCSTART